MKIQNINRYHYINNATKTLVPKQEHKCSFKAALWEEDYDEGSIFYHLDKKNKVNNVDQLDFSYYRKDSGIEIKDEQIRKMRISSAKYIGNDCYKGGMTSVSEHVKELKEIGIKKIIVLCNPFETNIKQACEENEMPLICVYTPLTFQDKNTEKDFIENFSGMNFLSSVKSLQEGNVFIGCESGNIRTNRFLHAVKLLDPMCKLNLGASDYDLYDFVLAQWIYKELSSEKKQALNYTPEFEQNLKNTLTFSVPDKFKVIL